MSDAVKYILMQATPSDFDSLRRLHHAAMREAVEKIWGWDEGVQNRFFEERFNPAKVQVVLVDGTIAGCLSVEERVDEVFLAELRISPEFQNKGIGSQVVKAVISDSARKGLPVMLTVLNTNRAKILYERLGFAVVGEFEHRFRMRTKHPDPFLLGRLAETEYGSFDDGKNGLITVFGTFVSHSGFSTRHDANQLLRCRCEAEDIEGLLLKVEEHYAPAGLTFRKISGHDSATGEALAAVLPGLGWKDDRTLVMRLAGKPSFRVNPSVEVLVVDPSHPDLEELMRENGRLSEGFAYHRSQTDRLGGEWLVAYLDGKPAGTTGWFLANGFARFRWVGTAEWARKQGVASALIQYVQSHPVVSRVEGLVIMVGEEIPDARRLYEKLGFKPVGWMWAWLKEIA